MTQSTFNESHQTAEQVLQRDRRRIRLLAGISIALWVAALFVIPGLYMPLWAKVREQIGSLNQTPALTAKDIADRISPLAEMAMIVGGVMIGLTLLTEVLAAISTVALVLTIRRVTLRQVTAGLAEVSEQLRQLRSSTS